MVNELLNVGSENAISGEELCRALHINNVRELQQIIAKERLNGAVILSVCTNGNGYYLPKSEFELRKFIHIMESRAKNTLNATKSAKKMLLDMKKN